MADLEIRVFGFRLLVVAQKQEPEKPSEPDGAASHLGGQFEAAAGISPFYDDKGVDMRFGLRGSNR